MIDGRLTKTSYTGFALAVAPELWNGLSEKEQTNVENWLGNSINEKKSENQPPV